MLNEIEGFRLSPQQKHLWHLQQTDSTTYRASCAVWIEGNLDIKILKLAIENVVNRHEILRTIYTYLPGMTIPVQAIADNGIAWNQNYDLSSCSFSEQEDWIKSLLQELTQQPLDWAQGPLLQLSLVTRSPSEHALLVSLPALSADTATLSNLVQEISRSYAACVQGEKLDNDPLQYADLAAWQNELLEGTDTEAGRDYWHKQDISALPASQLPFEKQSTDKLEFQPQAYTFEIAANLVEKIEAIAQQYYVSVSEFLLSCWQVLVGRITGQQNQVLGVKFDGRKYQELKTALGPFAKYLPLHFYLEPNCKFSKRLRETNQSIDELYKWQEYFSWEQLTGLPQNHPHFFPLCFEFEKQPKKCVAADVSFSVARQYACHDRFKVKLSCLHSDNALTAALYYDSNLFLEEDIKRLSRQFQTLLTSATEYPDTAISQLEILSQSDRQQQLIEFNQTQVDYSKDKCIHQLFEEQAARTPDNVALVFKDQKLTYAELNRRANQLAHYLQQLGTGPEVLVALCVERSLEMAVGVLGILKAGGAYVPLDPAYPKERLAFILQDAQPSLLLTQENLELPEHAVPVVCFNQNWSSTGQQAEENLEITAKAANLAYVIYTSGSTGVPKGVRVAHANLCHYVQAMRRALGVKAKDVYLHTASIAFSSSVRQLMVPLTEGATVKIATPEQKKDPLALFEGIKSHEVTIIDIVPSYWRNCIYALTHLAPESRKALLHNKLRLILSASEALLSDIPTSWTFGLKHQERSINMFGQTETSGIVAVYPIPAEPDNQAKVIPVGQPIANTQIYLLDRHLKPVPIGVPGEVYIGGLGLAQGYFNRPDLTAEKFIPDPFGNEPGARLYETGDLGRYQPDGNIEFLGRSDYQVKIRGFRIELGEIEAVLSQHPKVREVTVLAREDESANKRLVAYTVPSSEFTTVKENARAARSYDLVGDLGNFLRERLPDYMVPSTFVTLEALPLTPNGKVDRQALPVPEQARPELEKAFEAPRTPVEEVLAGIWMEILSVEQVGIHDNFFDLGGHSLLATQVVSQVRETFQIELRLRSLFETPTVSRLAECIETAMRTGQTLEVLPIEQVSRETELPLSFAQQRLWFLDQLEPGNPFYNVYRAVLVKGSLNTAALKQSFNEIVRRHEVLRTSFVKASEQPVQVIAPALEVTLPIVDLTNLPKIKREAEVRRLARLKARHSFDLTQAPLLEATLLQLEEEKYVLLFVMHHIVGDGWSAGVLVREVAALYESFCTGKPSPLPELPVQYADFAVWQRQWLQEEVLKSQMAYWKQQLSGSLPVLDLPTDRPRPAVQSFNGKTQSWQLSRELSQALKAISQREGVTLFMTLLAAFKTLLYRYTGQEDVLVGSPIANRNRREIEELIGFFVNTLVLRTDLSGNPSFRELLFRVSEVTLGAYTHQDLPFEQLVEELQPERDLSRTPLFQVMFVLQNAPTEDLKLPGLSLEPMEVESETARFDLTLTLTDTKQGLVGALEHKTDLFDATTITRMLGHFQTLLEGIVANPDQRLADLPVLTETERQRLLVEWNDTQADYPQDWCLHQLFEAQVEQTPDAIALVFENQQLTYRELNQHANQLANHLQNLGVGPEVLVGICVERSLEMVVGLLGILKAGGAYVPLDPNHPKERLAFILRDTQTPVLLTQQKLLSNLPDDCDSYLLLDTDSEKISWESTQNPISQVTSENLAYIIYTSGSTGQPKGTLIPHRGLVNYLTWCTQAYAVEQGTGSVVHSPLTFDLTITGLFSPLLVGRQVELVPEDIGVESLSAAFCKSSNLSLVKLTPAQLLLLSQQISPQEAAARTRALIIGGENLLAESVSFWQDWAPETMLVNEYGPTETVVGCCIYQVPSGKRGSGSIPIGKPIANTQLYVLNSYLQPVPMGVAGELYIGGANLARGYLNRPELSAEKFVPNPLSQQPGARLYKTGDLVRNRPDGNLEFLGRLDQQVKVRGFRIELSEIESLLAQHPVVREAVATVREYTPEDRRIVAYVVLQPEAVSAVSELQGVLKEHLPEYMMPTAIVPLNELPLTANGKVDRRSLPAPDLTQVQPHATFIAPSTPTEEMLAGIWAEILGLEKVGIHDNFFELGGHSLLATQVISRLQKVFQVELPLRQLFEAPTVARLAECIETEMKAGQELNALPIKPVSRDGELPLSFAQQRLWFLEHINPGSSTYNIPAAVRLTGKLDVRALEQSFKEIVRRHEALRTSFATVDGQPVQVIAPTSGQVLNQFLPLPMVDFQDLTSAQQEIEARRLAVEESQRPFNLAQGPMLRITLLRLSEAEHILLLAMHHIASDGWSIGVLIRELAALYEAFSTGKPSPLPELPIQYVDFAVWQRQWLQGESLEAQLAYWKQQLGSNPPALQLPTDRPRAAVKTSQASTHSFLIPARLSEALQVLSRQEGVTLFMTLLAGFQTLLRYYTHQDDIVVGTDVANRNRVETERLIGFFINLLVLRTDLGGNPTVRELLERVREVALGAYAHQDLPFAKLVEALRPERNRSDTPLFQVLFVLQNAPMPALELPGLTISPLEVENERARFDLALFLTETERGIVGKWKYKTELFEEPTIARMSTHFETLLSSLAAQPDARIDTLEMLSTAEREQQAMQKEKRKKSKFKKFANIKPKTVNLFQENLIETENLSPGETLPLVIKPSIANLDPYEWARNNREFIETKLLHHGAILFRNFSLASAAEFEKFAQAISPNLFGDYGDLPREGVTGKVYSSTPYPPEETILFHNESSHMHCWPQKIWFFCQQAAQEGGETPIVDCRKVFQLLDPKLREKFEQKQLMYVRNYTDGLDVSWQEFFNTTDKTEVEKYCHEASIVVEWKSDGGLRIHQVRPAIIRHPKTGESVFFNQIQLHHLSCLKSDVKKSLLSLFGEDNLPRHVYYGDYSPIEDSVVEEISAIYQEAKVSFAWQKGDVLMLDNMLTAHGRNPYVGSRKIVVAMGEMVHSEDVKRQGME
jgi:amino acid adenylation domain-containing protein